MANVTINDVAVLSGTLLLPLVGVWTADLVIDQPDGTGFDAGAAVTIKSEGGLELKGIVAPDRTGDFLDAVHVRVLGGKGGMAKQVTARAWVQPGAYVRDVLKGIADDAGEAVSGTADSAITGTSLLAWNTMTVPAARALVTLLDAVSPTASWRILPDGTLWVGVESWPTVSPTYDLLEQNPSEGIYDLGVESPTLVAGVNLDGVGNVSRVEHQIGPKKIRSRVWVDLPQGDRGPAASIEAMVKHAMAGVDYFALYEGEVKAQSSDGKTVDVQPTLTSLPGLSKVKLRHGIGGLTVLVANGAKVLVGWEGGDPSKPFACLWDGAESVSKIVLNGSLVVIGDESGAQKMLKAEDFFSAFKTFLLTLNTILLGGTAGSPVKQQITLASQLASDTFYTNVQSGGSDYLSTVAKNK